MGLSNSKSESESLEWNKYKTEEDFSSVVPMYGGDKKISQLQSQANQLISNIIPPSVSNLSTTDNSMFGHIFETGEKLNKMLYNSSDTSAKQTGGSEEFSNTSPFISSELYNLYTNKTNTNQQQGGSRKLVKKGGKSHNDDSDTSSTSSDSDLEDILDSSEETVKETKHKNKQHNKQHDKQHKKQHENKHQTESELSGGELSYLSSSAHTDRNFSDETSSASNKQQETQTSVTDENKYVNTTSASVNTTDINMVSDY